MKTRMKPLNVLKPALITLIFYLLTRDSATFHGSLLALIVSMHDHALFNIIPHAHGAQCGSLATSQMPQNVSSRPLIHSPLLCDPETCLLHSSTIPKLEALISPAVSPPAEDPSIFSGRLFLHLFTGMKMKEKPKSKSLISKRA